MELRCPAKKHGVLLAGGLLEIKCDSRFCGAGPGVVVLHRFDVTTGALVDTLKYKDPARKEKVNGTHRSSAAVRPA